MTNKNTEQQMIKMSDTSCLVPLPHGEGLVFIVTHTVAGELQSMAPASRKNIVLSADSTATHTTNDFSSTGISLPA